MTVAATAAATAAAATAKLLAHLIVSASAVRYHQTTNSRLYYCARMSRPAFSTSARHHLALCAPTSATYTLRGRCVVALQQKRLLCFMRSVYHICARQSWVNFFTATWIFFLSARFLPIACRPTVIAISCNHFAVQISLSWEFIALLNCIALLFLLLFFYGFHILSFLNYSARWRKEIATEGHKENCFHN